MIAVDQTTFGHPGGNCFSACVASLLHLSVEDVPYFMGHDDWYEEFSKWLKPHGFVPLTFRLDGWTPPEGVLCILGGKSPRGSHACVGRGKKIVHDPHPSRDGLTAIEDITFLIPYEPVR
jgi:hypothetical protein